MSDRVLVTGVSGFIGAHVAAKLLEAGYLVRGTVRNKAKGRRIVEALAQTGHDVTKLELFEADLGKDAGWKDAVRDCRYVQHIASPFPSETPSDREALVPEARAGAMRVIEQALGRDVERVVMTSSMVSMMGQQGRGAHMLVKETDWSDPDWKPLAAYPVSKTRAEKAVWAYAKTHGQEARLTTVCPGLVLGPDSFDNAGTSLQVIKALLEGQFPRTPKIAYPIVDVRDCAAIHVKAMVAPDAGGRRLMAAGKTLWFGEISDVLRKAYPEAKIPSGDMPNFALKLVAMFDDRVKGILPDLGTFHEADAAYVSALTGVIPRPSEEAILAAAKSLFANGTLKNAG